MMQGDVTRLPASAALRLGLLTGLLAVAGCSAPASDDKRDDAALKASVAKSMEIYKSKTQVSGAPLSPSPGNTAASKGSTGKAHPVTTRR